MVDTPRTRAALQTLLADNTAGAISPQDLRDMLLSLVGGYVNPQTGTAYTFALADANGLVTTSNVAAQTITIPPNADVALPVGCEIEVMRLGAGLPTIVAGAGVTLNLPTGIKPNRFMGARAYMTSDDTTVNATGGYTLSFDAADVNTDAFWAGGTPTRLTVPSGLGIKKVAVSGIVRVNDGTGATGVALVIFHRDSGGSALGAFGQKAETDGISGLVRYKSIATGVIPVTATDYFDIIYTEETDTSVTIVSGAFQTMASIEVKEIDPVGSIAFQYGSILLKQVAANVWTIKGDLG